MPKYILKIQSQGCSSYTKGPELCSIFDQTVPRCLVDTYCPGWAISTNWKTLKMLRWNKNRKWFFTFVTDVEENQLLVTDESLALKWASISSFTAIEINYQSPCSLCFAWKSELPCFNETFKMRDSQAQRSCKYEIILRQLNLIRFTCISWQAGTDSLPCRTYLYDNGNWLLSLLTFYLHLITCEARFIARFHHFQT